MKCAHFHNNEQKVCIIQHNPYIFENFKIVSHIQLQLNYALLPKLPPLQARRPLTAECWTSHSSQRKSYQYCVTYQPVFYLLLAPGRNNLSDVICWKYTRDRLKLALYKIKIVLRAIFLFDWAIRTHSCQLHYWIHFRIWDYFSSSVIIIIN